VYSLLSKSSTTKQLGKDFDDWRLKPLGFDLSAEGLESRGLSHAAFINALPGGTFLGHQGPALSQLAANSLPLEHK